MPLADALVAATDAFRRRSAEERKVGMVLEVGNARGDLVHAAHLAAAAGQSLDLLLESFEATLIGRTKAERDLLWLAYTLLPRVRREVREIHDALQAADEGLDGPTGEARMEDSR